MEQVINDTENSIKIRIFSRGYHDGSLYRYDIPMHRIMIEIMKDIDKALSKIDLNQVVECDIDNEGCYDNAYEQLGRIQDKAIDAIRNVAIEWEEKIQLPYLFWHEDICESYDYCYYVINLASLNDLFNWWHNPVDRDIIFDVLSTEYQVNISETDDIVFFDNRIRTSIHAVLVPNSVFKSLWYRGDLDGAVNIASHILSRRYLIPHDPDKEVKTEEEIRIE